MNTPLRDLDEIKSTVDKRHYSIPLADRSGYFWHSERGSPDEFTLYKSGDERGESVPQYGIVVNKDVNNHRTNNGRLNITVSVDVYEYFSEDYADLIHSDEIINKELGRHQPTRQAFKLNWRQTYDDQIKTAVEQWADNVEDWAEFAEDD